MTMEDPFDWVENNPLWTMEELMYPEIYIDPDMVENEKKVRYICSETRCNKKFVTETARRIHEGSIHGGQTWACMECGKKFKNPSNLQRHKKSLHNLSTRLALKCPRCVFSTRRADNLKRHMNTCCK
ncbi:MAG: C2H2-type zinc finger protein [Candidatus Peregrinibacteria bacterium]|nr:C2H2-type zinc finger protein [Candidatus Peregrinibacteria bacterium]